MVKQTTLVKQRLKFFPLWFYGYVVNLKNKKLFINLCQYFLFLFKSNLYIGRSSDGPKHCISNIRTL